MQCISAYESKKLSNFNITWHAPSQAQKTLNQSILIGVKLINLPKKFICGGWKNFFYKYCAALHKNVYNNYLSQNLYAVPHARNQWEFMQIWKKTYMF